LGGCGSGRRRSRNTDTTSNCCQIDVRRWQRQGLLRAGQCFALELNLYSAVVAAITVRTETDQVVLSHRRPSYEHSSTDLEYAIRLEWTPCHYGGTRAWFLCPARGCVRRVAILYSGEAVFACRHCYQLGYQSQREAPYLRATHRAQVIRVKLGGSANLNEPFPSKPDGMRWSTYHRLRCEAEEAELRSWPDWLPKRASVIAGCL
jgi:hypothetical protein